MDKLKAWMNNPKNMPFVIAGAVVIVGLVIFFIMMSGRSKKTATAPWMSGDGYGMKGMKGPGMMPGMMPGGMKGPGMMPGMMPGGMKGPMMMPGMMPGMGMKGSGMMTGYGMAGGGEDAAAPSAPVVAKTPLLPYRKDPFEPFGGPPSKESRLAQTIPMLIRTNLPDIRMNIKTDIPPFEPEMEVLPPQPFRRMSGVLMHDKISAILETNGESDVVVPGMIITRGNSKVMVESISAEEILLKTLPPTTKSPMYIKVNLAGSVAVPAGGAGAPAAGDGRGIPAVMGGPMGMPMGGPMGMPMGGPMGGPGAGAPIY